MPQASFDAALLERVRTGDAEALESLIGRVAPRVYRVAHGLTGNAADAEDVVGNVLAALLRPAGHVEARTPLEVRMYRFAIDLAAGKRGQVDRPVEEALPTYRADGHRQGERAFLLADWSRLSDEVLSSDEGRRAVRAAVHRLPAGDAATLLLRDVEALSNEDVSEVLREPVAAIKARVHRARMAVREQLTRAHASPA